MPLHEKIARARAKVAELGPDHDPDFDMKAFTDAMWDRSPIDQGSQGPLAFGGSTAEPWSAKPN